MKRIINIITNHSGVFAKEYDLLEEEFEYFRDSFAFPATEIKREYYSNSEGKKAMITYRINLSLMEVIKMIDCKFEEIEKEKTMKDEKYVVNNKIYNLSTSKGIYTFTTKKPTNMKLLGKCTMHSDVSNKIYKSRKGNFFKTESLYGRIRIKDICEKELADILIKNNELKLLEQLFPEKYENLEEV